jgi:hypothetical protein
MITGLQELDVTVIDKRLYVYHVVGSTGEISNLCGIVTADNDYSCDRCKKKLSPQLTLMLELKHFSAKE